jgi:hypothetical protein
LVAVGNSVSYVPRHYKIPRTYQYSFGFQHQLPKGIVADISFSGNNQIYGTYDFDMNFPEGAAGLALQNQAIADGTFFSTPLANPFSGILPLNSGTGQSTTRTRAQLLQNFPMWGGMTSNIQGAKYRSEELQFKAEKRAFASEAGALTWIVAWTFGKEYEQNHRLTAGWDTTQPLYSEISNQDKTHSFSVNGIYDLPFGKGRHFGNSASGLVNHAIGGWRADWILNYVSGYPVGMPNLLNYCGNWHAEKQDENHWFNNDPKCYADAPGNTLRFTPDRFSQIRQQQKPQLNAALTKDFNLTERFRLNLRGEGFNITNTPIRADPNTTRTSADFGKLGFSQKNFPRFFQLAAKFYF